ncbi:hypothetical protein [Streptomyces niger]|uniref:hypothetical protein n=1 Tax=Streptomyces niger TaxID=66373 RepID=UPI00069A4C52|nr:hypothetical protein [Streptomyces niger]
MKEALAKVPGVPAEAAQSPQGLHALPAAQARPVIDHTVAAGLLTRDGDALALTPAGRTEIDRLGAAWRRWLDGHLEDWDIADPADRAGLDRALDTMAARLLDEGESAQERTAV